MREFTLNADVIRLMQAHQAKQDVRYYLNGFLITKSGELVATDGHRMAVTSYSTSELDAPSLDCFTDNTEATITATVEQVAWEKGGVIVQLSGKVPVSAVHCVFNTDSKTVTSYNKKGQIVKVCALSFVDGSFPDWKRVVPMDTSKDGGSKAIDLFALNPNYLADTKLLCQGSKSPSVKFEFFGEYSPCKITANGSGSLPSDSFVVIMPIRLT